jgi:Fe-S-cluster containining protein
MSLQSLVTEAAARPEVVAAVRGIYADVQTATDTRKPICSASGKCCRFEAYGHRLYVTTIELAAFVAELSPRGQGRAWDGTGCPYQVDGLCSVHAIRPFGCRIFFCDPSAAQWQNEQYEAFHARIKRAHEDLNVPYRYVEWRAALAELGLSEPLKTRKPFDMFHGRAVHSR